MEGKFNNNQFDYKQNKIAAKRINIDVTGTEKQKNKYFSYDNLRSIYV